MIIYVVKQGDNVDSIAAAYNVLAETIIYNNQLEYPYKLALGQALLLSAEENMQERRSIITNGYAYPFISPWVLGQTLPYLTELSVFSYGFSAEGELIPPPLADTWMIAEAQNYDTVPVLTLTPFGPDGMFNSNLITQVLHNPGARERLIWQIGQMMQSKGFGGLDIDFEYISADDRFAFADFVKQLTIIMNTFGYQVSVALAPKTSSDQKGVLYEGKDYALLGAAANKVLLMTYEWGYTYGPPMAVAPINQVRRVVEYAVTEIPREKINLGIPNYGYDWPLPYERGVTKARSIGNIEAVQIAVKHNAEIQFDKTALSPFFHYIEDGIEHEVWFEDVRSLTAKFSLIQEFDLMGAGYWHVMQLFRANWLLLADTFWLRKV